uniref:Uncharacterized protein n=1 Tax=Anguilla anguilla TaxID=7936 RepID=A0A0E9S642_ANGAN
MLLYMHMPVLCMYIFYAGNSS